MREQIVLVLDELLARLKSILQQAQNDIAREAQAGRLDAVAELSREAQKLQGLIQSVSELMTEWRPTITVELKETGFIHRTFLGRASSHEITPREDFRIPILQALVELGGRAHINDVLKRVYELMEDQLTELDLQSLPSGGTRWRNSAMWERNVLKEEGYLRGDSPRGIWEITDEGRKYLRNHLRLR